MELRPYQQSAIDTLYDHLRNRDDNPCIVIPTGAGKTPIIAQLCRDAVELWNSRVLVLAHVKELLEQAAATLRTIAPTLDVGVYSAGLNSRDTSQSVIVAGIQSIFKRACELDAFDLILVDEAHLLPPDGEGMYQTFLNEARIVNPHVRLIGLTATPYRLKSGMLCSPENLLNDICFEVGIKELIADGYLCRLKSKAGRKKAETSSLHMRGGEFINSEVAALMDDADLVRSACREIAEMTADRNAVLIFASSVAHAQHVQTKLESMTGAECGLITGETKAGEREELIARFKGQPLVTSLFDDNKPPLKYLVNVNVLTTGFDAPNVDCVVLLRPTASPGLFYQMCLDMETEVLTRQGWRRCHQIGVGDDVAAFDLNTEEIVYVPTLDKVHRALRPKEEMYGIDAPHLNIRVTDQHTMVTRCPGKTCLNWKTQSAIEASNRRYTYTIPIAGNGSNYSCDAPLSDVEVKFIGWFLTDGYMNPSNGTVTISQSATKFADQVRELLAECCFGFREYRIPRKGKLKQYADSIQFVIPRFEGRGTNAGLSGWQRLVDWLNKDIPNVFDSLSSRQFGVLLQAMNLANGQQHKNLDYVPKVMAISLGCRERMADRIQQLAIERGFRCNIKMETPKPSDWNRTPQNHWSIYVKKQRVAYVGGTHEKISQRQLSKNRCLLQSVAFVPNEWVWCLTTEKGTLVTRRNGKVAVLGNCGRGLRLHPGKTDCLVLDYGDNILRHGPVDAIEIKERSTGTGEPPAKECPECQTVVHISCTHCPDCGFEFPPPDRKQHNTEAASEGILTGQIKDTEYDVRDVDYFVHFKRNARADAPRTMRVDYQIGLDRWISEWICIEHEGFAQHKAKAWWRVRSYDDFPKSAKEAVEFAVNGGVANPLKITVRSVAGEKYDRIIRYKLSEIPEPVENWLGDQEEKADQFGDYEYDPSEIPF